MNVIGNTGRGMSPEYAAAACMHPELPGCDPDESGVCDCCLGAARQMLSEVVPSVLSAILDGDSGSVSAPGSQS
jgi:hypothetical protein